MFKARPRPPQKRHGPHRTQPENRRRQGTPRSRQALSRHRRRAPRPRQTKRTRRSRNRLHRPLTPRLSSLLFSSLAPVAPPPSELEGAPPLVCKGGLLRPNLTKLPLFTLLFLREILSFLPTSIHHATPLLSPHFIFLLRHVIFILYPVLFGSLPRSTSHVR